MRYGQDKDVNTDPVVLHRVHGPPGTGKTTFLTRQTQAATEKYGKYGVVVGSLTRAAAAEVGGRDTGLPQTHIGTLHSHAFHALKRPAICETSAGLKAWNEFVGTLSMRISTKHAVDPENASPEQGAFDTDGSKILGEINILRQRMLDPEHWPNKHQQFWYKWCEFKTSSGMLDFTDLIEKCISSVDELPQKPAVFMLDEAQDMSKLEFTLAMKWGAACKQVVIVGDQDQNLYEWRGSDPDAFVADEAATVRTLSQSYRVPSAVHAAAVEWIEQVPDREPISYEPRKDEDGRTVAGCLRREPHTFRDPVSLLRDVQHDLDRGKSVMVIGTCGYMLTPLIAGLRSNGVPFWNPYRSKHGGWNPLRGAGRLLAFIRSAPPPMGGLLEPWTWGDIHKWLDPLQAKGVVVRGGKSLVENKTVKDRFKESRADEVANILEVLALFEADHQMSVADYDIDWWENHLRHDEHRKQQYPLTVARRRGFDALREAPRLVVGTIHSVKGGEADVVYLLPDLSGVGFFEGWRRDRNPILRQFYVGMTRAREELVLCAPSGSEAVKWL